jgi:hypothetical protein
MLELPGSEFSPHQLVSQSKSLWFFKQSWELYIGDLNKHLSLWELHPQEDTFSLYRHKKYS